jgi:hypothetical protein
MNWVAQVENYEWENATGCEWAEGILIEAIEGWLLESECPF